MQQLVLTYLYEMIHLQVVITHINAFLFIQRVSDLIFFFERCGKQAQCS